MTGQIQVSAPQSVATEEIGEIQEQAEATPDVEGTQRAETEPTPEDASTETPADASVPSPTSSEDTVVGSEPDVTTHDIQIAVPPSIEQEQTEPELHSQRGMQLFSPQ